MVATACEVLETLWPNDGVPELISVLAKQLAETLDLILELQESAARDGAQWAMSLVLSWHPDADIEVFNEGLRAGTDYSELRLVEGVHRAASTIADFIDFDDFIPEFVDPKGKKIVPEDADESDKSCCSHQPGGE